MAQNAAADPWEIAQNFLLALVTLEHVPKSSCPCGRYAMGQVSSFLCFLATVCGSPYTTYINLMLSSCRGNPWASFCVGLVPLPQHGLVPVRRC